MLNTIYALIETESRTIFYIGFTSRDPHKRLTEHKSAALKYKDGDELKYQYASALDALGVEWALEVLHSVDISDTYKHDDVEDYYISLYRHCPLTNMRAGLQSAWMDRDYTSIDDLIVAKQEYLNRPKVVVEKVYKPTDVTKVLYSFESTKKFTAPAFERLAKRYRK